MAAIELPTAAIAPNEPFVVAVVNPDLADEEAPTTVCLQCFSGGDPTSVVALFDTNAQAAGSTIRAEMSCGEALFELSIAPDAMPDGATIVQFIAECSKFDAVESDEAPVSGFDTKVDDEHATVNLDDADAVQLSQALSRALSPPNATKILHCLRLLRGRLWARPGTAPRLVDADVFGIVTKAVAAIPPTEPQAVDVAMEGIAVLEQLGLNPAGDCVASCAACCAHIVPPADVLSSKDGTLFHLACIRCGYCNGAFQNGSEYLRRRSDKKPVHVACAESRTEECEDIGGLLSIVSDFQRMQDLEGGVSVALADFLASEHNVEFVEAIRRVADPYVKERAANAAARCGRALEGKEKGAALVEVFLKCAA